MKIRAIELDEEGKNILFTLKAKGGTDLAATRELALSLEGSPFLIRTEVPIHGGKAHLNDEGLIGYEEISFRFPIALVKTFNGSFVLS